jgi:hypothetical protein
MERIGRHRRMARSLLHVSLPIWRRKWETSIGISDKQISRKDARIRQFQERRNTLREAWDRIIAERQQRLTQSHHTQIARDWSRDGRFVIYYEISPGTNRDLWILPITPEGKPAGDAKIYLQTPFNELWGRLSPERIPQWIAYHSDESGSFEVYIDSFPEPRGKTRISTGGGTLPQWGAGGVSCFISRRTTS